MQNVVFEYFDYKLIPNFRTEKNVLLACNNFIKSFIKNNISHIENIFDMKITHQASVWLRWNSPPSLHACRASRTWRIYSRSRLYKQSTRDSVSHVATAIGSSRFKDPPSGTCTRNVIENDPRRMIQGFSLYDII